MNRSLVTLAAPIPGAAMVYDWWVAITTEAFARASTVPHAAVQYRQRSDNEKGSIVYNLKGNIDGLLTLIRHTETIGHSPRSAGRIV